MARREARAAGGHGEVLFALGVKDRPPIPRGACSTLLRPAVGLSRVV